MTYRDIDFDDAELARLLDLKKSDRQIAAIMGCSNATIFRHRTALNLTASHAPQGGHWKKFPCDLLPEETAMEDILDASNAGHLRLMRGRSFTDAPIRQSIGPAPKPLPTPLQFSYCGNAAAMCEI